MADERSSANLRSRITNNMLADACDRAERALMTATGKQLVVDYVSRRGRWSVEVQGVAIASDLTKTECWKLVVMTSELTDFIANMREE